MILVFCDYEYEPISVIPLGIECLFMKGHLLEGSPPRGTSLTPHSGSIKARAHAANTYGFPLRVNEKICSRLPSTRTSQHCGLGVCHVNRTPLALGFLGSFCLKKRTEVLIKLSYPIRSSRWFGVLLLFFGCEFEQNPSSFSWEPCS